MPEIKHTFQGGKMNKDLDERLVSNGEYRDAMNIQVRTTSGDSDGIGNAGSVQNIKGNELKPGRALTNISSYDYGPIWNGIAPNTPGNYTKMSIIGSIADEKTDKGYFFVAGPYWRLSYGIPANIKGEKSYVNTIIEVEQRGDSLQPKVVPVVVDVYAIISEVANVFGALPLPSGATEYNELIVDDASKYSVGMEIQALSIQGQNIFSNAKIQNIDTATNTITLYNAQTAPLAQQCVAMIFSRPSVLKFDEIKRKRRQITGVNIIDDLLFWTDNYSEPKKINITRCKEGVHKNIYGQIIEASWSTHSKIIIEEPAATQELVPLTDLEYVLSPAVNDDLKEEHITVIRQAPLMAPNIELRSDERTGVQVNAIYQDFTTTVTDTFGVASSAAPQVSTEVTIDNLLADGTYGGGLNDTEFLINDIITLTENSNSQNTITGSINNITVNNDGATTIQLLISSIGGVITAPNSNTAGSGFWDITLEQSKPIFELKFGRFGYRYKYTDGEYSSFSPWSVLAFLPGPFDYNHKKGYNLGMVNTARQVIVTDFIPHIRTRPDDIVAVDILYKTTDNQNVYVVKTIERGKDPDWDLFTPGNFANTGVNAMVFGRVVITSEQIFKTLPSNQTLRAWDNVPRYALGQEIAANRLIYGNYVQGYDITTPVALKQVVKSNNTAGINSPQKSVKSIREYKFGMVFGDKLGRETPVIAPGYLGGDNFNNFSLTTGDLKVNKKLSHLRNKFEVTQDWEGPIQSTGVPPEWMDYVKYYVKETSNEYYNLVLSRWYEAEDGNIWLAFVSADRNKIDEETYLVLKNGHGDSDPISEAGRYKAIAIKNEAPDFIKIDKRKIKKIQLGNEELEQILADDLDPNPNTSSTGSLQTITEIDISSNQWDSLLEGFERTGTIKARFIAEYSSGVNKTQMATSFKTLSLYRADSTSGIATLRWSTPFGIEGNLFNSFILDGNTSPLTGIKYFVEIAEHVIGTNPEFDGKFFVKIEKDALLESKVLGYTETDSDYFPQISHRLGFISNQFNNPSETNCTYCDDTNMPHRDYIWSTETGSYGATTVDAGDNDYTIDNTAGLNVATPPPIPSNLATFISLGCTGLGAANEEQFFNNGQDAYVAQMAQATKSFWQWHNDHVAADEGVKVRMFIDNIRGRLIRLNDNGNTNDDGDATRNVEYYRPTGLDEGYLSGTNFTSTTVNGTLGRMFVSIGKWGFDGAEAQFKNLMSQRGTIFTFAGDPEPDNRYMTVSEYDQVDQIVEASNYSITQPIVNAGIGNQDDVDFTTNLNFSSFTEQPFSTDWNTGTVTEFTGYLTDGLISYSTQEPAGGLIGGGSDCLPSAEVDSQRQGFRFEFRKIDPVTLEFLIDINGDSVGIDTGTWDPRGLVPHDGRKFLEIVTWDRASLDPEAATPTVDAAIFETEPKEDVGLDIYYEASSSIPMYLTDKNTSNFAPYKSPVNLKRTNLSLDPFSDIQLDSDYNDHNVWTIGYTANTSIIGVRSNEVATQTIGLHKHDFGVGDFMVFTHKDETKTLSKVTNYMVPKVENGNNANLNETVFTKQEEFNNTININLANVAAGGNLNEVTLATQSIAGTGILTAMNLGGTIGFNVIGTGLNVNTVPPGIFAFNYSGDPDKVFISDTSWMDQTGVTTYTVKFVEPTGYYELDSEVFRYPVELGWFNCYSFGNGVESDRIRDDFNAPTIDNGVIVSTTFTSYGEEKKGSGMIYSGIYNSISGVNDLNEFNMADKITKDLNPSYGSIQALKTRDTNVVVLTEDKVLQVTTNRDALFNADGNPQLIASNRVLGTAVPFAGNYGISNNPESLTKDSHRLYFTDMQRGAVLRLSGNGLTPVSNVGMKTFFRENLKLCDNLLGTFDSVNGEYNLTLTYLDSADKENTTISFNEGSKGWVSFKSFVPQSGVSFSGKYFTALDNNVYEHHVDITDPNTGVINNRNTFYGTFKESEISILFNDMPGAVKSFKTINYEGTQAQIDEFTTEAVNMYNTSGNLVATNVTDSEFYNLTPKSGWYAPEFKTDMQTGFVREFINKENKWFNKISGNDEPQFSSDSSEFTVQGIGTLESTPEAPTNTAFGLTISADNSDDPDNSPDVG